MKKKNKPRLISAILCGILIFIGLLCFMSAHWYTSVYGKLGFDSIMYTMLSNMDGLQPGLVFSYLLKGLLPAVALTAVLCIVLFSRPGRSMYIQIAEMKKIRLFPIHRVAAVIISVVLSAALVFVAAQYSGLLAYCKSNAQPTTIYEDMYVDPDSTDIQFPEEKRNLIFIYLESMETTFTSREKGGRMEYDIIPELSRLAEENINFSYTDGVGGARSLSGSTWTIASMVAHNAGIPLRTPPGVDGASYLEGGFLPGATTLTDILHDNGYYQTLMVGSDADFGGRTHFYTTHNIDHIYDHSTAMSDGIIPDGYEVWWGMEDLYLYEYAKQELINIAAMGEPFAFTMLTVDTHHVGGYVCKLCGSQYSEQYENVLACASRQLDSFIDWLKQQDFYENTTIIICGDHPTMDNGYISRVGAGNATRYTYNCFINSAAQTDNSKNRAFTSMDLFPTTLSAMGCTIEGDRLGLGTDLFSDTATISEEIGLGEFNSEISKSSGYYISNFYFYPEEAEAVSGTDTE